MNIDVRKRFNESVHRTVVHDFVASSAFNAAAEAALIITLENLPKANEMGTAAANDFRMQGARLFLLNLMELTESPPTKTPPAPRRLDHKV